MSGEPTIKAIPTRYKGYLMRSRLEARWAVAFDHLGIAWQYEQEGYDVDGKRYLPDFWLPELSCLVEVKPWGMLPMDMLARAWTLARGREWNFMFLLGNPWQTEHQAYVIWPSRGFFPSGHLLSYCGQHRCLYGVFRTPTQECLWWLPEGNECTKAGCESFRNAVPMTAAFHAARSARFEHGECG